MEIIEINDELLASLYENAQKSERLRINKDLRTTTNDSSQRMLNSMMPGTKVPIHRHLETAESTFCLQGEIDIILYDQPNNSSSSCDANDTIIKKEMETNMSEFKRVRLCPKEGRYGVQIPIGIWHSVEVYEPSTIFEAKDGAYKG